MQKRIYVYKALVTNVYDGDTITVNIDLGLGVFLNEVKIRLFSIDAPEMRGPEKIKGMKSRDWLRSKILNKEITLQTIKDKTGKYGRLLGTIWVEEYVVSLNSMMVEKGLAEYKEY